MEETFEEKKRRALVERYGEAKGNRVADEGLTKPASLKKRRKREYE
jgi:hypothetical protein